MAPAAESLRFSIELSIDASIDVAACMHQMVEAASNVRDVRVKVHESHAERLSNRDQKHLFSRIGDLPKLKTLTFDSRDGLHHPARLPLQVLIYALHHAHQLKVLFLTNMILLGSSQDMASLVDTVRGRRNLEEFGLLHCQFPQKTATNNSSSATVSLDPLLRTVARLPMISVLNVHAAALNRLGALNSTTVSSLCQSKTLVELKLYNFDLVDDQVMRVARSLESNQAMEELGVDSCNFTLVTTAAFSKMIRLNSSLKWLELGPKQMIEDRQAVQLADALRENSTLKHFALEGGDATSTNSTVATAMARNTTTLASNFGPISPVCKDAFERMLEVNYVLTSLRVCSASLPEFEMYLTLNKCGRFQLLSGKKKAKRKDWIHALCKLNNNVDCIYYLLSINPFVCHTSKEAQATIRLARRGNKRRRLNPHHHHRDEGDNSSPEQSSSVNTSLSSSENLSSSTQSGEGHSSTDENRPAENVTTETRAAQGASGSSNRRQEMRARAPSHYVSQQGASSDSGNGNGNHLSSLSSSMENQGQVGGSNSNSSGGSGSGDGNGGGGDGGVQPMQGVQAEESPPAVQQQSLSQQSLLDVIQASLVSGTGQQEIPEQQAALSATNLEALARQLQSAVAVVQQLHQQQQLNLQPQPLLGQQVSDSTIPDGTLIQIAVQLLLSQLYQQPVQQQNQPQARQQAQLAPVQQGHLASAADLQRAVAQLLGGAGQAHGQQLSQYAQRATPSSSNNASNNEAASSNSAGEGSAASSTQLLYMPRDNDHLSVYQCYLRKQIELFEADGEDVKSVMPGRNKAIVIGQVGIRCVHCRGLPARHRGTGATYYPAKLDRVYQAAQNMAQTHFSKHCRHIPPSVAADLDRLLPGSKSSAGAGKKYWSDGARLLRVYEVDEILRLSRPQS